MRVYHNCPRQPLELPGQGIVITVQVRGVLSRTKSSPAKVKIQKLSGHQELSEALGRAHRRGWPYEPRG